MVEIKEPKGAIVQGPDIRVGMIPMSFDAASKVTTWFWFLAMAVDEKVTAFLCKCAYSSEQAG